MVAAALPANPSRVQTLTIIHHHGNDASTVVIEASTLRASVFMILPVDEWCTHTAGSIALFLLLCSGSN
jgi:hypothetical protein